MKSLWGRLAVGYGLAFFLVSAVFLAGGRALSLWPETPTLVRWQCLYGMTMLAVFIAVGWWQARRTARPLVELSDQLDKVDPQNVNGKIWLANEDPELRRLTDQVNDLLSRVHIALMHLKQYSAQVAHELRIPLTILRLKMEQAADRMDPALAEEFETELSRLTLHVERAILIAKAEQGHLALHRSDFDLNAALVDIAEGFRLLAQEEGRDVNIRGEEVLVNADASYVKQTLYNLLANALRHGRGTIHVRLKSSSGTARLLVGNQVKALDNRSFSLGLGRRIVAALCGVHGNMRVRHRAGTSWYFAQWTVAVSPRASLVHS